MARKAEEGRDNLLKREASSSCKVNAKRIKKREESLRWEKGIGYKEKANCLAV